MNSEKHKQAGNFYYCPHDVLGTGSWGTVYKARNVNDGNNSKWYALKKINKFKIEASEGSFQKYKKQVLSLQKGHEIKQIIKFVDFFKSQSSYYIITEYQEGSQDLYHFLKTHPNKFTELEARLIWYDLLLGISQLHALKITHRDLKLQNILYIPEKKKAKIIDFGLATDFEQVGGRVGSVLFMSPQIIQNQPYTAKCDIWSLGIIFYWMVCKCSPYGENPLVHRITEIMRELNNCQKLPVPKGIHLSPDCEEVIRSCLRWDQNQRKQVRDILAMKFFTTPESQEYQDCLQYYEPELAFIN